MALLFTEALINIILLHQIFKEGLMATNNSSSVIAGYFLVAVRQYYGNILYNVISKKLVMQTVSSYFYTGCPTILRCDRGSENS